MKKNVTRLGQHFLTRPEVASWVAEAVPLDSTSTVLEIGPGRGILTKKLLQIAGKVVAIEKDPFLVEELKEIFTEDILSGKLILLEEDVRDFTPEKCISLSSGYSLVANIPYYITGYIIRKFLTAGHQPLNISILIQKEVAERIVAKNKKQSLLSLSVHAYGTPKLEKVVKAGAFSPPPKVDSAILSIKNISRKYFINQNHEERFFTLIHAGFANKRKMLRKQLEAYVKEETYILCKLEKQKRAEDVSLEQWVCVST